MQPIDCVANDEPGFVPPRAVFVDKPAAGGMEEDVSAAVKRMENLEQSLIRMMDGLSTRSLRHIRQIKTDLHQMGRTIEELRTTSEEAMERRDAAGEGGGSRGKKKSNKVLQCPAEFIGGGTWPACYRLAPFNASWHEAKDYCTAIGANLVSLETIKEAYIVDYLIKSNTGKSIF